jgi:hypothetical protein
MLGTKMTNERVEDYLKDPAYERRIVAFCDVLGWRSQIAKAGNDPRKIGALRRQILLVQRVIGGVKHTADLRFSSFSDNIVLSGPISEETLLAFKIVLCDYQAYSAFYGFLTRGAITAGDICHDDQVVFGPALNRAYELESTKANYPRIIFDPDTFTSIAPASDGDLVDRDKDFTFLDPFTVKGLEVTTELEPDNPRKRWEELGLPGFGDQPNSSYGAIQSCLEGIKPIIRSPLTDKEYERVSWLYDRIAKELGVPRSNSYLRVRG